MLTHPNFDPVAFSLGPLSVHWYGVMYVLSFFSAYCLWSYRIKAYPGTIDSKWNNDLVSDLIFYGALGAVLGGRVGYALFYQPAYYLSNPLEIIYVNQGGMSFHGGLIGVILAMYYFARKTDMTFLSVADFVAPVAPVGLFFGRMGNFVNQELWGKTTDLPWGMVFTNGGDLPRHPSMLYEAFLEGLLLLIVLMWLARKKRSAGLLSGLFLIGYACSRIIVEFVRVPDEHIQYLLFNWVTMGQILSLPMLVLGAILVFVAVRREA